jgi:hypothetical protein
MQKSFYKIGTCSFSTRCPFSAFCHRDGAKGMGALRLALGVSALAAPIV